MKSFSLFIILYVATFVVFQTNEILMEIYLHLVFVCFMKSILDWILESWSGIRSEIIILFEELLFRLHSSIQSFRIQLFSRLLIIFRRMKFLIGQLCNQVSINLIRFLFSSIYSFILIKSLANLNVNTIMSFANIIGSSTKNLVLLPEYYDQ